MRKTFGSVMMAMMALGGAFSLARAEAMNAAAPICRAGTSPAILVHIAGIKPGGGTIRVQAYGGDPSRYFEKGTYLERIDVPTTQGSDICVPVPKPGVYAISVRHDVNGNGKSDMSDGGGMSGNPGISLFDLAFRRKPKPSEVQVHVSEGVTPIRVVMNYVHGGAFAPIATAKP